MPNSFESTTRTRRPPMLTEATWRTVWRHRLVGTPTGTRKSASHTGWGLAVQVAIQCSASAARAGEVVPSSAPQSPAQRATVRNVR